MSVTLMEIVSYLWEKSPKESSDWPSHCQMCGNRDGGRGGRLRTFSGIGCPQDRKVLSLEGEDAGQTKDTVPTTSYH